MRGEIMEEEMNVQSKEHYTGTLFLKRIPVNTEARSLF